MAAAGNQEGKSSEKPARYKVRMYDTRPGRRAGEYPATAPAPPGPGKKTILFLLARLAAPALLAAGNVATR